MTWLNPGITSVMLTLHLIKQVVNYPYFNFQIVADDAGLHSDMCSKEMAIV